MKQIGRLILFFIGKDRYEEKVFTLVFQKPSEFRNIVMPGRQ
jgi:hypothetical protein